MALSEKSKETIKMALRKQFDNCNVSYEYVTGEMQSIIDTAKELSLIEFANELQDDLLTELKGY